MERTANISQFNIINVTDKIAVENRTIKSKSKIKEKDSNVNAPQVPSTQSSLSFDDCANLNELFRKTIIVLREITETDFEDFLARMRAEGYEVKETADNVSFREPGRERFTRSFRFWARS